MFCGLPGQGSQELAFDLILCFWESVFFCISAKAMVDFWPSDFDFFLLYTLCFFGYPLQWLLDRHWVGHRRRLFLTLFCEDVGLGRATWTSKKMTNAATSMVLPAIMMRVL